MIEMRLVKDLSVGRRKEPFAVGPSVLDGLWKAEQILRGKPVPLNGRRGSRETRWSDTTETMQNKDGITHEENVLKPRMNEQRTNANSLQRWKESGATALIHFAACRLGLHCTRYYIFHAQNNNNSIMRPTELGPLQILIIMTWRPET